MPTRDYNCQSSVKTIDDKLSFKKFSLDAVPQIDRILKAADTFRSCDFTLGGIFLWIDYFHYRYTFLDDGALVINGVSLDDVTRQAFSIPIGGSDPKAEIEQLKRYCEQNNMKLRFSAVPASYLRFLVDNGSMTVQPLDDWADYLYNIQDLATLHGKHFNKKRNHVNRFMIDNPGYTFEPLSQENIDEVIRFADSLSLPPDKPPIAEYELIKTRELLRNINAFPFEGAVLSTPNNGIVAFTIAEPRGDTLHIHIEKMRHEVAGAGETINQLFAAMMAKRHPELQFINRQDDSGDEGLRRAKLSYHPVSLVKKFNVEF